MGSLFWCKTNKMKILVIIIFVYLTFYVTGQDKKDKWRQVQKNKQLPQSQSLIGSSWWRMELKTLLYEYSKKKLASKPRQIGFSCVNQLTGSCSSDVDSYFKNIKQVLMYKAGRLDSFENKRKRLKSFIKTVRNKRKKAVVDLLFNRTTHLLEYTLVNEACHVNETLYEDPFFNYCKTLGNQIFDKANNCTKLNNKEDNCKCYKEAKAFVAEFKNNKCHEKMACAERAMRRLRKIACVTTFRACKKEEDVCITLLNICSFQHLPLLTNSYQAFLDDEEDEELESRLLDFDQEFEEDDGYDFKEVRNPRQGVSIADEENIDFQECFDN